MARDDAESTLPADADPGTAGAGQSPPGRRQRAVDLFSSHRYRALQLSAFERRKSGAAAAEDATVAWEDDDADPLVTSDAPAARSAREVIPGTVDLGTSGLLTPVPVTAEDEVSTPDPELHAGPGHRETVPEDQGTAADVVAGMEYVPPTADADSAPTETHEDVAPRRSRNFVVATAVGLLLLGAALVSAWYHPIAFAVLVYGFCIAAVIEWKRALARHGRRVPVVPLIAATVGLGVATHFSKPEGLVVALLVGCAGIVAWRIGDERVENTLADSLAGVLTLLWIPFLGSFLYLLELADDGWQRVFIVIIAVVGNDTGALVVGMLFGRHKLLERVSPAKTWEGAIGGVLVGTMAASVAAWAFFDGQWFIGAAVGGACTLAAIVGDLAESALKRDIRVKDMSQALPGHGGILDRIDSLLFAAPVGYVVFAIFLGTLGGGGL